MSEQIRTSDDEIWKRQQRAMAQMRKYLDDAEASDDIGVRECAIHNAADVGFVETQKPWKEASRDE